MEPSDRENKNRERRRIPRITLPSDILCRTLEGEGLCEETLDISPLGMRMTSSVIYARGDLIPVFIRFGINTRLEVIGEIKWSQKNNGHMEYGLEFKERVLTR